ncbi:MAG: M20/M25/M40 family metallo-hydrolase [Oscillospiraceae bacterium]|nr:M20/M25/M40 family metallo-hydrolase [Oscillospiraceae bacterium]
MNIALSERLQAYLEENRQFHYDTTVELAQIPAPSNKEEKRAQWVKEYFDRYGGTDSYIDSALNCVLPLNCEGCDEIVVFMAHTDVVFPDETPLPLEVRDGRIYCPGISDDTANVTALLLIARYILENRLTPKTGLLIVANSGEEGLGNLKGSRQIMEDYKGRIKEFISFDGTFGFVCNDAVGSHRYSVEIKTEGGHSYGNFGNRNAIAFLASMINTLYTIKVPPMGKTTYNVGTIEGGTSVNTIAQNAKMLYEYRSDNMESLAIMEKFFNSVCESYRSMGVEVNVEILGKRPCKGAVDEEALAQLTETAKEISYAFTGIRCGTGASSTDCNTPLSQGVPAVCLGLCRGRGAHTRGEWLEIASLPVGAKIAGAFIGRYFDIF